MFKKIPLHRALLISTLATAIIAMVYTVNSPYAYSQSSGAIAGWAWSDNIGWISLNCSNTSSCGTSNYGLTLNADNTVAGYGWSEHIGWVKFGGLSGFPDATAGNARVVNGVLTGWAKALAGEGGAQYITPPPAEVPSGWDGWIKLASTPTFKVDISAGNDLTGWAWGGTVIGWLQFQDFASSCFQTPTYFCDGNVRKYRDVNCAITTIETCTVLCDPVTAMCVSAQQISGSINAVPKFLKPGATTNVVWQTQGATNCTVTGNGDSWGGITGNETSSPINDTEVYTLNCTGGAGVSPFTRSVTVGIAPAWRER